MFATFVQVFGGLAIFVYGMKLMSDGLHQVAGEKMRGILKIFSANPLAAVASGAAVTCVIQSSSASTVMVIGFVNAGLISLVQAMGLIFGANIGTTITAQLVAFDISWVIMPAIIAGLLLGFSRHRKVRNWSESVIGFGFLFLGMGVMSTELKELAHLESFKSAFLLFQCAPVDGVIPLGALIGAVFTGMAATMLIQSSSACSGVVIALGASGLLDIYTAVALILGSNIGTTVTAQLAAITANRIARQAAMAHTLFNVLGVIVVCGTFLIRFENAPLFFYLIRKISLNGDLPRQIANAHTVFNVFTTLILLPFIPQLAALCEKLIPVTAGKIKYQYLEPHLLDTPEIALNQTAYALKRMLQKAWRMIDCALNLYNRNDAKNQAFAGSLESREADIDKRQQDITEYLSQLMEKDLKQQEAALIPLLLHCTNDVERIGDHTAVVQGIIRKVHQNGLKFSPDAEKEYDLLHEKLAEIAGLSVAMLSSCVPQQVQQSAVLHREISGMLDSFESEHIERINSGACRPQAGILYLELLSEIRKVSRHLKNINERAEMFHGNVSIVPQHNKNILIGG